MSPYLGSTDLRASRLGLGTVELGMPYGIGLPQPPADADCIALLHRACEAGVTFIDTAAAYGRSEELVGRAFGRRHDRPAIATKVATQPAGAPDPLRGPALRRHLEASVASSLARLQLEQLDLLQFHNLAPCQLAEDLFGAMESLCTRGWVRYWGASTYGPEAPLAVTTQAPRFAALQVAYSLLDRTLEERVLPACRAAGMGTIFRSVLLKGVLSERYKELPAHLAPLQRAAAAAAALANAAGMSLTEMALRFAVHSPWADVVLFGTAAIEELQSNLRAAAAGPLPDDLIAAVRRLQVDEPHLLNPATWGF